jgi:carbonic anhydrase
MGTIFTSVRRGSRISLILAFAIFSVLASAQEHHAPHWSYEGATGPEHWGDLNPEYSTCKIGQTQSPIDITNAVKADLPAIEFHYSASPLKIVDNGHTVQVNYAPGSYIVVGGKQYNLVQFHFHHPSEEEINGTRSDLVIHLVHKSADGQLAVVGVLFNKGAANPAIETMVNHLPTVKNQEVSAEAKIKAEDLLPSTRNYYTFSGSLTTPPCTEGVRWFVLQTSSTLSSAALEKLAKLYPNNARPVQPLHGRVVNSN